MLANIIIMALIIGYCAYLIYDMVKKIKPEESGAAQAAVQDAVAVVVDAAVLIRMK